MSESKFYDLKETIIDKGICTSCGACVALCPVQCLELKDLKPNMLPKNEEDIMQNCAECSLCLNFCPRTKYNNEFTEKVSSKLNLGNTIAAKTQDPEVQKVCQDGGVVTSLLKYLFDEELIDGAVVSKATDDWNPEPIIIQDSSQLLKTSGTRYSISPNVLILNPKYLNENLKIPYEDHNNLRLAFVGTPCQVEAIKKLQGYKTNTQIFPSNLVKYTIGLFCMENFEYDKMIKDYVSKKLKIKINSLKKMNISKGKLKIDSGKEPILVPIKELDPYTKSGCHYCTNFSNLYADVSVGNIGSGENISTVILRNDIGRELVEGALKKGYLSKEALTIGNLAFITKMENIKRKKAKKVGV